MAFDLLTVPAMSAEIERVFSECSLALNHQRLSMTQETLEDLMCLRSWLRNAKRVETAQVSQLIFQSIANKAPDGNSTNRR